MFEKKILFARLLIYSLRIYVDIVRRNITTSLRGYRFGHSKSGSAKPAGDAPKPRSIVIIGASFAGYFAARLIATSLPRGSPYRVVVIEPHSHFHFTWVLPRFCVVKEHEHKAFIPYGPYLEDLPAGAVRWVQDRVISVDQKNITLRDSGEKISYDFLLVATGSGAGKNDQNLPSRVGADEKREGLELLRGMQTQIMNSKKLVVVGGGAAGVELATDAKAAYPEKTVVLVHSRDAVMHRFGPVLQAAALQGLNELGVEVILGERLVTDNTQEGSVVLSSGRKIDCDFLINCTGQKPASHVISELAPDSVSESGHIRVKSTMQIDDEKFSNVYACGDVTNVGTRNPNSRIAMQQAKTAADNIVLAAGGRKPTYQYTPHWAEGVIKLTLGLDKSVTHFGDTKSELLFHGKESDIALMSGGSWKHWRVTPFEDDEFVQSTLQHLKNNGF